MNPLFTMVYHIYSTHFGLNFAVKSTTVGPIVFTFSGVNVVVETLKLQ